MCGIAGIFSGKQQKLELKAALTPMLHAIEHRGPDDEGQWIDTDMGLALGHRRLSIIDLSSHGHQPMESKDGRYVLAYVGEVYNYQSLRQELEAKGVQFGGTSDTEVLVELIALEGVETALSKINGMFSIALWDKKAKQLYLIRDRLGVKPLYYGFFKGQLLFGSELKALMAFPQFCMPINKSAVYHYFHYGYVPEGETVFQDFHKVRPGSFLTIDGQGAKTETIYWVPNAPYMKHFGPDEQTVRATKSLFEEAVMMRTVADVPVGCFLSGGIDSTLVTACMQQHTTQPVKTFSIGFEAPGYNEATFAKQVATHLKTDHHEAYIAAKDVPGLFDRLMHTYDEPFGDASMLPTFAVSELAAKDVTVVLSGDGGDEVFAGYNRHVFAQAHLDRLLRLPPYVRIMLQKAVESGGKLAGFGPLGMLSEKWQTLLRPERFSKLAQILGAKNTADYYRLCTQIEMPKDLLALKPKPVEISFQEGDDVVRALQLADLTTYLPGDILTKVDRATMAHSLEGRAPFLDYRVVEFGLALANEDKIHQGQGKWILRKLLADYVPTSLFNRPKTGFGLPLELWFKSDLKDWLWAQIKESQDVPFVRAAIMEQFLTQHSGHFTSQQAALLWRYIVWAAWWKKYSPYVIQ